MSDGPTITTRDTALKPLEDTIYELSVRIANHEETYPLLQEFAYKLLMIAGVKVK